MFGCVLRGRVLCGLSRLERLTHAGCEPRLRLSRRQRLAPPEIGSARRGLAAAAAAARCSRRWLAGLQAPAASMASTRKHSLAVHASACSGAPRAGPLVCGLKPRVKWRRRRHHYSAGCERTRGTTSVSATFVLRAVHAADNNNNSYSNSRTDSHTNRSGRHKSSEKWPHLQRSLRTPSYVGFLRRRRLRLRLRLRTSVAVALLSMLLSLAVGCGESWQERTLRLTIRRVSRQSSPRKNSCARLSSHAAPAICELIEPVDAVCVESQRR